jgi:hypothetical protein
MTIFNNIKRGATDAANKAAKKTGEITNIAKLTMNIKNAETKLGAVYEEIGRLFYTAERTGEDFTSDIAANIMKADKIKADIANFKSEIAALRNVIVCENCGNEVNADFAFCNFCGSKIEKPAPAEEETCECCECECDGECECDCECECNCCCEESAEECTCECCCEETAEEPCCCCEETAEEDKAE